jgi:hypothetical protein
MDPFHHGRFPVWGPSTPPGAHFGTAGGWLSSARGWGHHGGVSTLLIRMDDPYPPTPRRRRSNPIAQVVSLPALFAIVLGLVVLAGLALLPTLVWQTNPLLWRQLLRMQGGAVGLVVGAVLGFLVGRFLGRRR